MSAKQKIALVQCNLLDQMGGSGGQRYEKKLDTKVIKFNEDVNKTDGLLSITSRNVNNFKQFFMPILFECDGCSCVSSTRASNCGFILSGQGRCMSFVAFNQFQLFDFKATEDENSDLHTMLERNDYKNFCSYCIEHFHLVFTKPLKLAHGLTLV